MKKKVKPINDGRLNMDLSADQYEFIESLRNRCHAGSGCRLNKSAVIRAIINGGIESGMIEAICKGNAKK